MTWFFFLCHFPVCAIFVCNGAYSVRDIMQLKSSTNLDYLKMSVDGFEASLKNNCLLKVRSLLNVCTTWYIYKVKTVCQFFKFALKQCLVCPL